jgi:CubicO group peptidase (beta-lactamase class C family)
MSKLPELGRRTFLQAATGTVAASLVTGAAQPAAGVSLDSTSLDRAFRELDAKIQDGMERFGIPGVAVGVLCGGRQHLRGYGVTNVDNPVPVGGDTVFRVASTTKTFTGTAAMRLVERGKLDLDARVRRYLPDFSTADPTVGPRVTVRQLLNHTPGFMGDDYEDTGQGDDALARYVAGMARLPQLTPVSKVFAYNNAALAVVGRVIEVITGTTYEQAMRELVIDPLGLKHSRFFEDELADFDVAAAHDVVDGKPIASDPPFYAVPRSFHPFGGLVSSVRDQLRYARFHLGDGRAPGSGERLLSRRSLTAMRSHPGPGGSLFVELDGMGVTWMLRPSAQGVRIVQHGGDLPGFHSGFIMVPERGFAITMLTNSETGPALLAEFFAKDWALRRFAGVSNLPAVARTLPARALAPYEGSYVSSVIGLDGILVESGFELVADGGRLVWIQDGAAGVTMAFYRHERVLLLDGANEPLGYRADFIRGADGEVAWLRLGGRLYRHVATADASGLRRAPMSPMPLPTLPYLR